MTALLGLAFFLALAGAIGWLLREPAVPVELEPLPPLIRNEQAKISANFLNGIAVSMFTVGALGPVLSSIYGVDGPSTPLLATSVVCFLIALALHYAARMTLRRLEP